MKRKRLGKAGYKKGKKKETSVVNDSASAPVLVSTEDQSDDGLHNSEMDGEPHTIGLHKPINISSIVVDADLPNDRSAGKSGHGHFKVKLKSSRVLEPHRSSADVQTPSDTDKSNPQFASELNEPAIEKEDSLYSDGQTSEMQDPIQEKLSKKAGSIKIKSSRGVGVSSESRKDKKLIKGSTSQMLSEKILVLSDNEKSADSSEPKKFQQRETKVPQRDPRYNDKELSSALEVIKKVMKMEAAVPFNAPVDPVALGIPDYFDIIDTPMDFGTICQDLERGSKYMNSEDVFKDVQYIWENCYKYNNKGDYILDLMKRVKKNFMKYWMAAELYMDMPSNGSTENILDEGVSRSNQDKFYYKGKSKHKRRRYGIDRHKSDCLCAVCVVRRRRMEREQNSAVTESQMMISNGNVPQESKLEETSPLDNPGSEDATSSPGQSQETDANVEVDEEADAEERMEASEQIDTFLPRKQEAMDNELELSPNARGDSERSHQQLRENGPQEDSNQQSQQEMDMGLENQPGGHENNILAQQHDQLEKRNEGESADRSRQIMVQEYPLQEVNASILQISRTLFPSDLKSVWNGPHSLCRRRQVTVGDSPIHAAMAALMRQ